MRPCVACRHCSINRSWWTRLLDYFSICGWVDWTCGHLLERTLHDPKGLSKTQLMVLGEVAKPRHSCVYVRNEPRGCGGEGSGVSHGKDAEDLLTVLGFRVILNRKPECPPLSAFGRAWGSGEFICHA
jgi:hypothetical protein